MRKYKVKYCRVEDARDVLELDGYYDTFNEAMAAVLHLEEDPDIYTAWSEEVYDER